jgi:osmotically-inducible protein OsmY
MTKPTQAKQSINPPLQTEDSQLQQEIMSELYYEPSINAAHIGVAVNEGIVTLTGHVESFSEKYMAEKAAGRVKGVKALAEDIEVRLPFDKTRADDEIAAAAIDRLAWDTAIPSEAIKVKVDNGWITLTGQVEWNYQKDAAEQDVRRLFGVTGVSNQATIKPTSKASNIKKDIEFALSRSWSSHTNTITVSETDGEVQLSGTVHSWHDRKMAVDAAWAAPGVTEVENDIMVI